MTITEKLIEHLRMISAENPMVLGYYFQEDDGFRYDNDPSNVKVFASLRVDGVRLALLKLAGKTVDDYPVVHLSPTDERSVTILADDFMDFLELSCGYNADTILERIFSNDQKWVSEKFHSSDLFYKLFDDDHVEEMRLKFGSTIVFQQ